MESKRRSLERCGTPRADIEDRIDPKSTDSRWAAMVTLVRCLARQAALEAWERGSIDGYPADAPVAGRLARRLTALGFTTPLALKQAEARFIREKFSVTLERTVRELQGTPCIALEEAPPDRKTIVASRSLGRLVTERRDMEEAVASYAKKAAQERDGTEAGTGKNAEAENAGLSGRADRGPDRAPDGGVAGDAGRQSEGGAHRHRPRSGARLSLHDERRVLHQGERFNDRSQPQRRRH